MDDESNRVGITSLIFFFFFSNFQLILHNYKNNHSTQTILNNQNLI